MYHDEFLAAEASAQAEERLIWDQSVNAGGQTRDYSSLVPWWNFRGSIVQDYRQLGIQHGVLSVRMDYEDVVEAAKSESNLTVLCDLQSGINKWTNDGALIYGGSKTQKFNLWIPDRYTDTAQAILRLIEKRYANHGRSYVYVSGQASTYRETPQIVLTDITQLSDIPPI
jgi:micrococcal nuclease